MTMTADAASWFLEWMAESALRTIVLAVIVAVVMAAVRMRGVDTNRVVWRWILATGLLMPVLLASN